MTHVSGLIRVADGPGDATTRRLTVVALLAATVLAAHAVPRTPTGGSELVYLALLGLATGAWLAWARLAAGDRATLACLGVLAAAGGLLGVAAGSRDGVAASVLFATVASGAAAQRFPLRLALAVAGIATLALLADVVRTPAAVVVAALVIPATVATGLARRQLAERAEVAEQLLAEAQRTREERARAAALDERVRVAREVHDVLAHSLTALAISLETAEVLLDERHDVHGSLNHLRRARRLAVDGLAETRGAVAALRGTPDTLAETLARLISDYRADTSADATLLTTGDRRTLAPEPTLALQRIAQEALTNIRRHAPGAPVHAALHYDSQAVRLSIDNDLPATPAPTPSPGGGYGLRGMQERADACGGRLAAGAADGRWRVAVELPA